MRINLCFSIMMTFLYLSCTTNPLMASSVNYAYDNVNRLTKATYNDGTVIQFAYDATGNRTSSSVVLGLGAPTPSSPSISDGATRISLTTTLSWVSETPNSATGLTYDVYFGTQNFPTTEVLSDSSSTTFKPTGLKCGTTYYWKVIATDASGLETNGSTWSFTTVDCNGALPALLLLQE